MHATSAIFLDELRHKFGISASALLSTEICSLPGCAVAANLEIFNNIYIRLDRKTNNSTTLVNLIIPGVYKTLKRGSAHSTIVGILIPPEMLITVPDKQSIFSFYLKDKSDWVSCENSAELMSKIGKLYNSGITDEEILVKIKAHFADLEISAPLSKHLLDRNILFKYDGHIGQVNLGWEEIFIIQRETTKDIPFMTPESLFTYLSNLPKIIYSVANRPSEWSVLGFNVITWKSLIPLFFPDPRTVPLCANGHSKIILSLSSIRWKGHRKCSVCGELTDFGVQTCEMRCFFCTVCKDCSDRYKIEDDNVHEKIQNFHAKIRNIHEKIQNIHENFENRIIACRLSLENKIPAEEYLSDPVAFDENICVEIARFLSINRNQVAVLNPTMNHNPMIIGVFASKVAEMLFGEETKNDGIDFLNIKSIESIDQFNYPLLCRFDRFEKTHEMRLNDASESLDIFMPVNLPQPRTRICPNNCGMIDVPDLFLRDHLMQRCSLRNVSCSIGCGKILQAINMDEHEKNDCDERLGFCESCNEQMKQRSLSEHIQSICPMRYELCECGHNLNVQDMEKHVKNDCHERDTECNWCMNPLKIKNLANHRQICPNLIEQQKALMDAIWRSQTKKVKQLLLDGLKVNSENTYLCLHAACSVGNVNILNYLLKNGADISRQDKEGLTPLHVCALRGQTDCFQVILSQKPDLSIRDLLNRDVLTIALFYDRVDILKLIASQVKPSHDSHLPDIIKDDSERT